MGNDYSQEKPLISFIVTLFNQPIDAIKQCLSSIIALSLRPIEREIIVVDDGSNECVMVELQDFRDDIIYIRQRNKGVSAARNTGIRMAEGQYLQFVDGEDRLLNEGYEHCIDIVRYNAPDIVLFDSASKESTNSQFYIPEPVEGSQYMRHNNINTGAWGYVFNRRILLDLRFTVGLSHEYEEFTPQLFLRAERVYSTNIAAYYRHKRHTLSAENKDKRTVVKRLNDMEHIILHLKEMSENLPLVERQAMERRVAQLTIDYIFSTIKLTRSSKQLNERLERLEEKGLFPLPNKRYTTYYSIFRRLTKSRIARKLIALALK